MRILERKDIQSAIGDPLLKLAGEAVKGSASRYCICTSSGTSGRGPMLAVMSAIDIPEWVGGSKRRITCFGTRNLRLRNLMMVRNDPQSAGSSVLSPDPADLTTELSKLLGDYKPDSVRGGLSFAIKASAEIPVSCRNMVTTIHVGGEAMTEQRMELLKSRFPSARIRAIYVIAELFSAVSLPSCGHTAMNRFHPAPHTSISVLEPDESGYGELLVEKRNIPSIDTVIYRPGDVGRMCGPCECGQSVTFEVAGRRGFDYVRLAGAVLRREEFDRVLNLHPGVLDDYRVEVSEAVEGDRIVGKMVLKVFRADRTYDASIREQLTDSINKNLYLTPTRTLGDLVSGGFFAPLVVEFLNDPIPQKFKEIKIVHHTAA